MATFPTVPSVGLYKREVFEYDSLSDFPPVGTKSALYIDNGGDALYRWDVPTNSYKLLAGAPASAVRGRLTLNGQVLTLNSQPLGVA